MEDNYSYDSYEAEIDLLDLLFDVLSGWRLIVICALLGLALLGGYKFYKGYSAKNAFEAKRAAGDEVYMLQDESYKACADSIKAKIKENNETRTKALEKQTKISEAEAKIAALKVKKEAALSSIDSCSERSELYEGKLSELLAYKENSVLFNLDANACPAAAAYYEGEPTGAGFEKTAKKAAAKYNIPENYARELVYFDIETLTLTAYGSDVDMAAFILSEAMKEVPASFKNTGTEKGIMRDERLYGVQKDIIDVITEYRAELSDCETKIMNANADLSSVDSDIANLEKNIEILSTDLSLFEDTLSTGEAELSKLEKNLLTAGPSSKSAVKSAVKWGIIGIVAGGFVSVMWLCAVYVLSGKLYTPDQFKALTRLPVLCVLGRPARKNACCIDRFIEKKRAGKNVFSDEDLLNSAKAAISEEITEGKDIVVISSEASEAVNNAFEKLKEVFGVSQTVHVTGLSGSPSNIEKVKTAGTVLLLEDRQVSKTGPLTEVLEKTELLSKKPCGIILA